MAVPADEDINWENKPRYGLDDLVYLMRRLRDPDDGCPWDLEQSYASIVPSTIEEAYEVADAIERKDLDGLREELGDYLFQAIFYSQLASEEDRFDIHDVIHELVAKLVRRHPHVFPEGTLDSKVDAGAGQSLEDQIRINRRWEEIKQEERASKGLCGVFDDLPNALPALIYGQKTQKRAAKQNFDWSDVTPVYEKLEEEIRELKEAYKTQDQARIEDELGDLLFSCVNVSRHIKVDAETALRRATNKFQQRFLTMQKLAKEQDNTVDFADLSEQQMEQLWQQAKIISDS